MSVVRVLDDSEASISGRLHLRFGTCLIGRDWSPPASSTADGVEGSWMRIVQETANGVGSAVLF